MKIKSVYKFFLVVCYLLIINTNMKGILFNEKPEVFGGAVITAQVITGTPFCIGMSSVAVPVPYHVSGAFGAGNVFTAQLSNSIGSFAIPIVIGTLTSTTTGTILANIPAGTPKGTGYLIRVVSSNPVTTSISPTTLTINSPASILTQSFTAQSVCANTTANLALTAQNATSYQWYSNNNSNSGGTSEGILNGAQTSSFSIQTNISGVYYYYCGVMGSCGTMVPSNVYTVNVNALPIVQILNSVASLCLGDTDTLTASGAISYLWNTSATTNTIAITPTITTTYNVAGTDNNGCVDTVSITQAVTDCTTLPIDLLFFNAKKQQPYVNLVWATISQTDNAYFSIERSSDGKNFLEIKKVAGLRNSEDTVIYTYVDTTANQINMPIIYYRLSQTDFNGKRTFFLKSLI
jgi:hypothetical protein